MNKSLSLNNKILLLLILSMAFYINFIPHMEYRLPLHVDEWRHFAESQAILDAQSIAYVEPYLGEWISNDLEIGFHVFLAIYQKITGIDWVPIFVYLPGVIFIFTVLAVYVFAEKFGCGLEAAFLAAFFPTTVRLLGPSFLVPVSLGLFYIALCLFMVFNIKNRYNSLIILVVVTYLFLMHPPTAIIAIIVLLPYIILSAVKNPKQSIYLILTLFFAFVILSSQLAHLIPATLNELISPGRPWLPYAPETFKTYGYLPTALFVIGIFYMTMEWTLESRALILAFVALIMTVVVFARLNLATGITEILYSRTYLYAVLLMNFFGGFGLKQIRLTILNFVEKRGLHHGIYAGVYLLLIILILITMVNIRTEARYYQVISEDEYNDFKWIKENIEGDKAILHPWKAIAFAPITNKKVYSKTPQWVPDDFINQRIQQTYAFLLSGCSDINFLRQNKISFVYYSSCTNPELENIRKNIYIVRQ